MFPLPSLRYCPVVVLREEHFIGGIARVFEIGVANAVAGVGDFRRGLSIDSTTLRGTYRCLFLLAASDLIAIAESFFRIAIRPSFIQPGAGGASNQEKDFLLSSRPWRELRGRLRLFVRCAFPLSCTYSRRLRARSFLFSEILHVAPCDPLRGNKPSE